MCAIYVSSRFIIEIVIHFKGISPTHSDLRAIVLKWSMHGNRLAWKIGFIIGIICHLSNRQQHSLLVVSGENEDVIALACCQV